MRRFSPSVQFVALVLADELPQLVLRVAVLLTLSIAVLAWIA